MDAVTICNLALLKIGNQTIVTFTDGTAASRFCNLLYSPTVNEVMRASDWSFAKGITQLTQISVDPAFDWAYAYQLPNDFSRIVGFNNFNEGSPDVPYEIMGYQLLTNATQAYICYIKEITDPNLFDAITVDLLSIRLAQRLAQPLARSTEMEQSLGAEFKATLEEARRIDGATSQIRKENPLWVNSGFVNARWNGLAAWGSPDYIGTI